MQMEREGQEVALDPRSQDKLLEGYKDIEGHRDLERWRKMERERR